MRGTLWQWVTIIFGMVLSYSSFSAITLVTVEVTIMEPPPCTINSNNIIDINFGNDVATTQIDGVYKKIPVIYDIDCKNNSNNAMQLKIAGEGAIFDEQVLSTTEQKLGISLMSNGSKLPINTWLMFTYPNIPKLEAVLVKEVGADLAGGGFSAGATMLIAYQ